ncbi:dihydrofolate reductase [Xylariaceae sp. FL0255]|nr:dihydrofolate reductase [Xylariaceae sp. FL0255]
MPPRSVELTLVVAATRSMGIGKNGTLPWTGLKKEMAYFARVTKKVHCHTVNQEDPSAQQRNAVIMGRKTWDSIPPKFRPLKDRLNIVISRSHSSPPPDPATSEIDPAREPIRVSSLEQAIAYLYSATYPSSSSIEEEIGSRAFVIGGAQIYEAALKLRETRRVLLTSVASPEFDCDTFFPLVLAGEQRNPDKGPESELWVRSSKDKLDKWTGETVPEGLQEENGTKYEFQMWERV